MKRYNIPSYTRNVKRSTKNIVAEQMRNIMPTLSETVTTTRQAMTEMTSFTRSTRIPTNTFLRIQKRAIFGTFHNFIHNAKEDLKSGNFYNEERMVNTFSGGNGIDDMIGGFGDVEEFGMSDSELDNVRVTSKFDKYLKSTTNGVLNSKQLSNSLNEVNINNTDYMANINTSNTVKMMTLTTKNHMEQMKQLKNLETIGMSMMKFNEQVIASAIERQDRFHDDILNETRELKDIIRQQTELNMSRFKSSTKVTEPASKLDSIFGNNGGINFKEYLKNIKGNIKNASPMGLDDIGMMANIFGSSPISAALSFILPTLMPKEIQKNMKELDKTMSGMFAKYFLKLNDIKRNGKNSGARLLAEILGIDMRASNKPNLSIYRNQDMTLELEQKKAKAITEVIPTYLSSISEALTGINKSYDYSRGVFVDKTKRRAELDKEHRTNIVGEMYDTRSALMNNMYKHKMTKNQYQYLENDLDNLLEFLAATGIDYNSNMSYESLRRKGLRLDGGAQSYKFVRELIKGMTKGQQMNMSKDILSAHGALNKINYRRNISLQETGNSMLYNQYDDGYEGRGSYRRRSSNRGPRLNKNVSRGKSSGGSSSLYDIDFDEFEKSINRMMTQDEIDANRKLVTDSEHPEDTSDYLSGKLESARKKMRQRADSILQKLAHKGGFVNTLILGINDGLYKVLYGDNTNGQGILGRLSEFASDMLVTAKATIFGEYDGDKTIKEGILPKKVSETILKYLPKAKNGAIIGGLAGLTIKNPFLGALAGASLNLLLETDKVKKFLWGDSENGTKGLLGGIRDKLNEKILDPAKKFLREKFNQGKDMLGNKIDGFFDVYDTGSAATSKVIGRMHRPGSLEHNLRSTDASISAPSGLLSELERGIYSSQLDTIISLLSGGFGFTGEGDKPITPTSGKLSDDDYGNISKSIVRRYKKTTLSNRVKSNKTSGRKEYADPLMTTTRIAGLLPAGNPANDNMIQLAESTGSNVIYGAPDPVDMAASAIIVEESAKDPAVIKAAKEKSKYVREKIKQTGIKGFNLSDKFSGGGSSSSGSNGILGAAIGTGKGIGIDFSKINGALGDRFGSGKIGRGQGGLIGMALGSMLLSNPLLGAVAGMTFSGKSKEQKALEDAQGGSQYKVGRTALKYAALSTLLGLGPMSGLLVGAMFPQKKKSNDPNREPNMWEKFMEGSSTKGKILGALAGSIMGFGLPGMIIGGIAGGKLMGKKKPSNKIDNDVKYKKVIDPETGEAKWVERSQAEQEEYLKERQAQEKEAQRLKTARGTIFDKLTGGGKLKASALGTLAGLAIGGLPGMLIGGIAGAAGGTRRGKLNRDMTSGILSGQGKWKAGVLGAIAGNALMGPLFGPLIGGLAGSLLTKKTDQKFWRYDEYGNVLTKDQQKLQKQKFKDEYRYDENGNKLSFWDAQKKKREIMKRENDLRDANASSNVTGDKKKIDLDKLEIFQTSKAKGAMTGAMIGTHLLGGPIGGLAGAGIGALVSGKKNKQPDGTAKKPFFVRDVNSIKNNDKHYEAVTTRAINKMVDADKKSDAKRENTYKESIDKINNSSLTNEQKREARDELSSSSSAMYSGGSGGNGPVQEESKGLFDGWLGTLLGLLGPLALGLLGKYFKGDSGHGSVNEHGDRNHANFGDKIIHGAKMWGSAKIGKWLGKIPGMGKLGSFSAFQTGNAFSASSFYGNEADAYSDQGDYTNAEESRYGQVTNFAKGINYANKAGSRLMNTKIAKKFGEKIAGSKIGGKAIGLVNKVRIGAAAGFGNKAAQSAITFTGSSGSKIVKGTSKIASGVKKFLDKIANNGVVKKLLGKNSAIGKCMSKITTFISGKFGKQLAKHGGTLLAKILGKVGQIASVALAVIPIATAITAFVNGWNNVANELNLSNDYEPSWWERLTCALVYALDDFLCGAIDIFGLRDDLISLLIGVFGGEKKQQEIAESQAKASEEYEKFLQENDLSREAFTMEQYQNATNKTVWGHVKSWFGAGDDLSKYKKGSKKNEELRTKYGGYNSSGSVVTETGSSDSSATIDSSGYTSETGGIDTTNQLLSELSGKFDNFSSILSGMKNQSYIIQNNQKTAIVTGGSYENGLNVAADALATTGGRGTNYLRSKALVQSKAQKPLITSISFNSKPEETVLDVMNNEHMQNIMYTAYMNQDGFDPTDKSTINAMKPSSTSSKDKKSVSQSFGSKILSGITSGAKNIWSGIKSAGKAAVSGTKWLGGQIWSGIKSAGKAVGNFGKWIWNGITGGRGNAEDPDYYNQQDPRWSNMSFGIYDNKRDTVGDGGCGPTTAATVIQKMTGRTVTPAETSKFALNNGYKVDNGGTTPDYFNAIGSKYGIGFNQSNPTSNETINSLQQGKPVIFLGHDFTGTSPFGNESHYVVGTGMDKNGNISVLDPKNRGNNGVYNIRDIATNSMRSIVPNYSGGRGKVTRKIFNKPGNSRIAHKMKQFMSKNRFKPLFARGSATPNIKQNLIPESWSVKGTSGGRKFHKGRPSTAETADDEEGYNFAEKGIAYIVLHYTAGGNDENTNYGGANGAWSGNNGMSSSAHYVVHPTYIEQNVSDTDTAFHCRSGSKGTANKWSQGTLYYKCFNENSIGIEQTVSNNIIRPETLEQSRQLVSWLMAKYNIPLDHVVRHGDVTNKGCPAQFYGDSSKDKAWNEWKATLNPTDYNPNYKGKGVSATSASSTGSNPALSDHDDHRAPILINGFPWYSQHDSRWSSETTHGSSTMSSGGCGPTALACILTSYGISIDPSKANKLIGPSGYSNGINHAAGIKLLRDNGLEVSGNLTFEQAVEKVKSGIPVWMSQSGRNSGGKSIFTSNGHMMVLSGFSNGELYVTDPSDNGTGSVDYRNSKYYELAKSGGTAKSGKKISSIPIELKDVKAGYMYGYAVSKNGKGSINNVGTGSGGSSSTSSSSGGSSNPGNRLLNRLSSMLEAMSTPANSILNNALNTMSLSYDNSSSDTSSSSSTSSSTSTGTTSSTGTITSDDLGKTVTTDQAHHRDPRAFSKITSQQLKDAIVSMNSGSYLQNFADDIMRASEKTGLDPRFITAFAIQESGWNGSKISKDKNNYFGIGAIDSDPYNKAHTFSSPEEGFTEGAQWILDNYINAGQNTLWKFDNAENGWHNYNSGGTNGMLPYAKLYSDFINATGGAGRGGRGNNTSNLINKRISKSKLTNPFVIKRNTKDMVSRSTFNSDYNHIGITPLINPTISKYSTPTPIIKSNITGGRGMTPIPSTASVIDALSMKSSNSVMTTLDSVISKSRSAKVNSSSNSSSSKSTTSDININSFNDDKLDRGNELSTAILGVLQSIAGTLERIERNAAISSKDGSSSFAYGRQGGGESLTQTYKQSMMNSIIAGN